MVRQPEKAKHHHNSQDELLAADLSAELGLPQASQDEDVAGYDDCIRKNEARHCLKGVLKPHLHTGGYKTDVLTMIIAQVSVDMNGSVRTRKNILNLNALTRKAKTNLTRATRMMKQSQYVYNFT